MVSGVCRRQTRLVLPQQKPSRGINKSQGKARVGKRQKASSAFEKQDWFERQSVKGKDTTIGEREPTTLDDNYPAPLENLVFIQSNPGAKEIMRRKELNRYMTKNEETENEMRNDPRYMDAVRAVSVKHNVEEKENRALNVIWSMLRKLAEGSEYDKVLRRGKRPVKNQVCGQEHRFVNEMVANEFRTETKTAVHPTCVLCEIGGVCGTLLERRHTAFTATEHESRGE